MKEALYFGNFWFENAYSNRGTCRICNEKIKKDEGLLVAWFNNRRCAIHSRHFNEEIRNEILIHML